MIFKVDYHFHPNLPKSEKRAKYKCEKWWQEFQKFGVNVVISTEHCYKNPERAFSFLEKARPKDCYVFPGVEYLTKEGVDIVIFSHSPDFYKYEELVPFKLSYEEVIDFVGKKGLLSFVTHPYTLGLTSVIKKIGKEDYLKFSNQLGAIEIANGSFDNLYLFLNKSFLKIFFKGKTEKIKKIKKVPESDYPERIKFLSAGSDAHHFEEIGTYVTMEAEPENLFEKIVSNQDPIIFQKQMEEVNYFLLIKSSLTAFQEFIEKKKIIIKNILK